MVENIRAQRKMVAILRILAESSKPMGSTRIAEKLRWHGLDLSERTIRNYLSETDQVGWTVNLGRRGRLLTDLGRREGQDALAFEKVGFVSARVDNLTYEMTFDPHTREGKVVLNISFLKRDDLRGAWGAMRTIFDARLGMGRYAALGIASQPIGSTRVPAGHCAFGTVCSVSINGMFLRANIATTSRFGGLLEFENGEPKRFTEIIMYDGSSLDPLEIFIRGHMTSVTKVAETGSGVIGASFREVPAAAVAEVQRLATLSERIGVGGVLAIGSPDQPLFGIPVAQGRVGLVVCGGLNPVAAVAEAGIEVTNMAMSSLFGFDGLTEFGKLGTLIKSKGW